MFMPSPTIISDNQASSECNEELPLVLGVKNMVDIGLPIQPNLKQGSDNLEKPIYEFDTSSENDLFFILEKSTS